ncbi:hypothetical protein ACO2Q3_13945 [Caulobacter sp. KR2-114]|uniref:hypothetical protein n=1 Tax=Caulobacter sp. KR2-114 TaxID=3400912 RepID=UPI003C0AB465
MKNALALKPEPTTKASRHERAAVRVTGQFFLRQAALLIDSAGGDLLLGLVYAAITAANTEHMDEEVKARYAELDEAPPDELRRPISVLALSASLQLPYETTRRYVARLEEMGLARRLGRAGVIIPKAVHESPRSIENIRRSYADVHRFVAGLRKAGVDVDAMR